MSDVDRSGEIPTGRYKPAYTPPALIHRRGFRAIGRVRNPFDQALNGADVDLRFGLGCHVSKFFKAENICKGFARDDLGSSELALLFTVPRSAMSARGGRHS